ncbi:hypothetical protein GBF38_008225 [Nibea albiflora]|uniref:Uncharacterized protein n=1 Tax=Nibea albiflora TaxID=240163 RepID=A0ACB7EPX0_NIBAL|nr:hypothetical protein GBF38_008225 [Nibea albiflora]
MLTPYEPVRSLRSSGGTLLIVSRSRLKTRGDRASSITAPRLWKNLREEVRLAQGSLILLNHSLKLFFFFL